MPAPSTDIRRLVRRHNAATYMLIMLISFSTSVVATRLFLTVTGFPKIGGGDLHIAHLLWGGLLLFFATTLQLVFSNRWIYIASAVFGGAGAGLFIDEVGKFITSNNDYFYPLAMPIIYAFFLIVVVLYLQVRRPHKLDPRAEMYRAFEAMSEVLDHDLEPYERDHLLQRLQGIERDSDNDDLTRLAQLLHSYVASPTLHVAPEHPGFFFRLKTQTQYLEQRWLGPRHLKAILTAGLVLLGVLALAELIALFVSPSFPPILQQSVVPFLENGEFHLTASFTWFMIQLALEVTIGLMMLIASVLLILGKDRRGHELAYLGLLLSLTIVNLLLFYFDQFGNLVLTLFQIVLLGVVIYYRQQYLTPMD